MKLISIEAQGFKKLRNFSASFTSGLNVIVGDNAVGKSTLLQAIECALYGAAVVPGKKEHMVTWGQKSWKVTLEFSIEDDVYELTRSKSTAKLVHVEGGENGDRLVANGNTPVTKHVEELLGLNAKDYNLFMQSKQGETSGVLTFGAAALNRKVESFAGISLIDEVQGLAQEEYRTSKAEADALDVPQEQIEGQESDCAALNDELHAAEVGLKEAQDALEATPKPEDLEAPNADPDALQRKLDNVRKLRHEHSVAKQELEHAQGLFDEAWQRLEDAEEPQSTEKLKERSNDLRKRVKEAAAKVSDLQEELSQQRILWKQLHEAVDELDRQEPEDEVREFLIVVQKDLKDRRSRLEYESNKVVELNQKIKQLQSLRKDANCPTCGTRLSEHDPEKLAAEIEQLAEQRDAHEREKSTLEDFCKSREEQATQFQSALDRRQAIEAKVDKLREDLVSRGVVLHTGETQAEADLASAQEVHEGLISEKSQVDSQLEKSEEELQRFERLKRSSQKAQSRVNEAMQELTEVSRRLEEAESGGVPDENSIEEARQAHSDYQKERNRRHVARLEAQQVVDNAKSTRDSVKQELAHAQEKLENLRKTQEEAQQAVKKADKAGRLARFLRDRRAGYLQEVWDAVLGAASKQVAMASNGMVTRLVYRDGDFLFEEEGILAPVASASGAQKAHIGVALRVGLSRALYGDGSLLIFDEPTESMREHHAQGLSASLAGASAQCLLITHREQDQDLAANVVEVS